MYAQVVLFDGFDPLDVIAPYEVLWAGGAASGGALTVELVSAEGPREVVGGSGGLILHATAKLNPDKADIIIVPGASGPINQPEEGQEIDTIPILLARTMQTDMPALMRSALDNPKVLVATVCGGSLALGNGRSAGRTSRGDKSFRHGCPRSHGCHSRSGTRG